MKWRWKEGRGEHEGEADGGMEGWWKQEVVSMGVREMEEMLRRMGRWKEEGVSMEMEEGLRGMGSTVGKGRGEHGDREMEEGQTEEWKGGGRVKGGMGVRWKERGEHEGVTWRKG